MRSFGTTCTRRRRTLIGYLDRSQQIWNEHHSLTSPGDNKLAYYTSSNCLENRRLGSFRCLSESILRNYFINVGSKDRSILSTICFRQRLAVSLESRSGANANPHQVERLSRNGLPLSHRFVGEVQPALQRIQSIHCLGQHVDLASQQA